VSILSNIKAVDALYVNKSLIWKNYRLFQEVQEFIFIDFFRNKNTSGTF
jgi:hypothetical protein